MVLSECPKDNPASQDITRDRYCRPKVVGGILQTNATN
jgi:hypothetical protein